MTNFNFNLDFSSYTLEDLFHGFSAFVATYPDAIKATLHELFFANCISNPLVCFSMFANSLTRSIICDDDFFREHSITYQLESVDDRCKNSSRSDLFLQIPQWGYTNNNDTNTMILMMNILIDIVYSKSDELADVIKVATINPGEQLIESEGKFMVFAIRDEPFKFHVSLFSADGSNFCDDLIPYFGLPILNGIKTFNYSEVPLEILYMPAV